MKSKVFLGLIVLIGIFSVIGIIAYNKTYWYSKAVLNYHGDNQFGLTAYIEKNHIILPTSTPYPTEIPKREQSLIKDGDGIIDYMMGCTIMCP